MKELVILIPGIMGSELKDNGKVIWPGSLSELMLPYKHMKSLRKPKLEVGDIIRDFPFEKQYADLVASLNNGGFKEGAGGTLRVYPYDWRRNNVEAAKGLADLVDEVVGSFNGDCSITLLAHSMGGLISRYYLESGIFSERDGFSKVATLITMGTPHQGAPMALAAAVGMEKRAFLNAEEVKEIANNENFPSLYQLLPPKREPFAWDRDPAARYAYVDIYDDEIAKSLKLSATNLEHAKSFHSLLGLERKPENVRYFFFAGTQLKTTSSVQVKKNADGSRTVYKDERDDAGDGTVPFWSSSRSGIQTESVGGAHATIYKGDALKFILGGLLGQSGKLAAHGDIVEVAVNPPVVEIGDDFQVVINLPVGTNEVQARLILMKVNVDGVDAPVGAETPFEEREVRYSGPEIDHLAVVVGAPKYPGVYKVGLATENGAAVAAFATVIVQDI